MFKTTTNNSYSSVPYQFNMHAGICICNQQYQERPVGGNGTVHWMGAVFINTMNMMWSHLRLSIENPHKVGLRIELTFFWCIYIVIKYVPLAWVYYNSFTRTKTSISTVLKVNELLQWITQINQPKYPSKILIYCSVSVSTLQTAAMDKYVTQSMPF
jgi:hypothetical protein